jgi:hypothetical protein
MSTTAAKASMGRKAVRPKALILDAFPKSVAAFKREAIVRERVQIALVNKRAKVKQAREGHR